MVMFAAVYFIHPHIILRVYVYLNLLHSRQKGLVSSVSPHCWNASSHATISSAPPYCYHIFPIEWWPDMHMVFQMRPVQCFIKLEDKLLTLIFTAPTNEGQYPTCLHTHVIYPCFPLQESLDLQTKVPHRNHNGHNWPYRIFTHL